MYFSPAGKAWLWFTLIPSSVRSWMGAGESRVQVAMSITQEEAKIKAGSLEFYRIALPAGPILVLGFMCLEGREVSSYGEPAKTPPPASPFYLLSSRACSNGAYREVPTKF